MLNYDMALEATESSMNSFNSAQREQDKYNESLEGRINRLSNAWYGFANAVGQSVLYDTIVVVTEGLKSMTDAGTGTVKTIGILTPLFATLGIAVFALSGNLRTLVATTFAKIGAFATATSTNRLYMASFIGLTAVANAAKVALQGLLFATGVGIAFAALGAIIGKVTNAISENIQEQEKYEEYLEKNTTALSDNKAKTEELIASYKELSNARANGHLGTEKEQEYLDVQNQLAEIYPALIERIDSTGQAHLKNSEAINKELASTKELIDAKNKMIVANSTDSFGDLLTPMNGSWYESFDNYLNGSLESRIKQHKQIIESAMKNGVDTSEWEFELLQMEQQFQIASEKVKSHIYEIIKAMADLNDTEIDDGVFASIQDFVNKLDLSNLDETQLASFTNELGNLQIQMQQAIDSGDKDLFRTTIDSLNELASKTNGFEVSINGFKVKYEDLVHAIENGNTTLVDAEGNIIDIGDASEESSEKVESLADTMNDLGDAVEIMAGVSQKGVDALDDLIWQYDMLSMQLSGYTQQELEAIMTSNDLTDKQRQVKDVLLQRKSVMEQLSSVYPDLLGKDGQAIVLSKQKREQIELENKANKVLLEAYKLSRDGKLTAEQNMTLASAQGTKNRLSYIQTEIDAITAYFKAMTGIENPLKAMQLTQGMGSPETNAQLQKQYEAYNTLQEAYKKASSELGGLTGNLDKIITSVNSSTSSTNKNTSSTGKNTDATKTAVYVSDQYKKSLDAVNLAIEKQQKLTAKQVKGSQAHRDALKKEIDLQKQKVALMEKEAKSLSSQISSGKIKQTGMISDSSKVTATSGTSSTTTRKLSGWGGNITDTYGTVRAIRNYRPHTGVDIKGAKGTRLESNVNGKVIATGNTKLSGNYVQILDNNGMKHFYGHLDKIVAKLGDVVKVGTHIGNIGNTGNSTGPHLHYEIKNASGKNINPIDYVYAAKGNVKVSTSSSSSGAVVKGTAAEKAQAVDQAKSELTSLQQSILQEKEALEELMKAWRQVPLIGYDNRRATLDEESNYEAAKIQTLDKRSDRYDKTLDKQTSLLERKQKVNNEELAYLQKLIRDENIVGEERAEYIAREKALKTAIMETTIAISQSELAHLDVFDARQQRLDNTIDYERTKLEEVDENSNRYVKTLQKIRDTIDKKQVDNQKELDWLDAQIKSGKHAGDVLDDLRQRFSDLQVEMKATAIEAKKVNYEMVQVLQARFNEDIDDKDFRYQRSKTVQSMYDVGSKAYMDELEYQLGIINDYLEMYPKHIKDLEAQLKDAELNFNVADTKQLREDLEDATLAYYNWQLELINAEKAKNDAVEDANEELINSLIDSYKDYLEEKRDADIKAIEDSIEAENERHENVIENYEKEREEFQRNIDEKLRQLDRAEAERDYNMEIDDLEKERNKVQDQINLLQFDNSHEAKSKRKKLQEQLDKIDKDIAERRHDRDIELQKQGLSDLSEAKDEEIDQKVEAEDEYHDYQLQKLEDLREYTEQMYTDMLNDERKFQQMRVDIADAIRTGNLEKIKGEFGGFLTWLEDTMPDLENTLDGTMKAVGTTIRQNIIDRMREALELFDKLNDKVNKAPSPDKDYGNSLDYDKDYNYDNPDPIDDKDNTPTPNTDGQLKPLSDGDLKVLLGKYISDVVSGNGDTKSKVSKIKEKGHTIAAEGRAEGSQIPVLMHADEALKLMSDEDKLRLADYASKNFAGLITPEYIEQIKKWAESIKNSVSLDTGGFIKRTGSGMDGKGGGLSIIHPNEVVESPYDVKRLMNTTSMIERISKMLAPAIAKLPTLSNLATPSMAGIGSVEINLNGDIYNDNNRTAKDLVNEMAQELRTRGRW